MPKTKKSGEPKKDELPSTVKRSSKKAQRTFAKAYDAAVDEYDGNEERAHRVAYSALKQKYARVGKKWKRKDKKGPSDSRSEGGSGGKTHEGVDAKATKDKLLKTARRLGIKGRSTMRKRELVEAIKKENKRETDAARRKN
ncbi:ChaB family protein [Hoyosella altamirensis]|uniref:Cation transport regulator ChaB n=1 Tax=Hoyosella altamirensis TaxID=616997 RepID=A0A839RIN8_9ACTN|nr:ChaB family protein [Hoyosella altamirensis]MBB3035901.1 cation transport regulator ChaB [Hoyosella altamirensis]